MLFGTFIKHFKFDLTCHVTGDSWLIKVNFSTIIPGLSNEKVGQSLKKMSWTVLFCSQPRKVTGHRAELAFCAASFSEEHCHVDTGQTTQWNEWNRH